MATNLFNPFLGSEERVLNSELSAGSVYFTTDTRKIYLDIDENHAKLPMGGNIGLFYGNMVLSSPPVEGQTEFEFKITEIVGNEFGTKILKPNIDDLILNSDGCFYKVLSSYGDDIDTVLTTKKLTIAGTGGGNGNIGGDTDSLAGMTMSRLRFDKGQTVLYQASCPVSFAVKITDDLGDPLTGNVGTYDLYINSKKVDSGNVVGSTAADVTDLSNINTREINTVDVGPYLMLGENISVKISVNGVNGGTITRAGVVSTTNMALTWDYDETDVNIWDQTTSSMDLEWTITGNLEKTTHIIINDDYANPIIVTGKNTSQSVTLNFVERNLWHGAHKIEMYATAEISGGIASTPSICKNIIVAKHDDESAIISCGLFDTTLTQYNTIQIPIIIYDPTNTSGTAQVKLIENGEERDTWEKVENSTINYWSYTPITEGTIILTIQCNGAEKSLTLTVEPVDIEINEKENYKFKFKASEFASNGNVQKWNSNGINAVFSSVDGDVNKFDWYNGGLKTETDNFGNSRQYLCIKAGSQMTINYAPWAIDARTKGKCLKVIFKATKCKDYDGQVLKCHDGNTGLIMRAQNAVFSFAGKTLAVPYCEDEYIEFELDITPNSNASGYKKRYIRPWLDGVPAGVQVYSSTDNFASDDEAIITIGSSDCDVYLYMIKMYESHLSDEEHLNNFIADAPNATEMIARFERNDILDESGEISYTKLAEKNPNCYVHLYEMDRMTKTKKDPVNNCLYTQYHGSRDAVLSADNVTVKVQGTSSAAYGLAAFNLDSDFKNGFTNLVTDKHIDKWSMSPTAIPVDYFCTKVNVASAEGTNNALNQEWYNKFQPYQTVVRGKRKGEYNTARDCMEFVPGVVFIKDNNPETNDNAFGGKGDNVFKDTIGYCDTIGESGLLTSSYYKMYSIGCMGNSKDNIEVFHDSENPYECCVENGDNQLPGQWMTDVQGGYSLNDTFYPVSISSISAEDKTLCPDNTERDNRTLWENAMDEIYGFRYPDGIDDVKKRDSKYAESMIQGWYDFVYWMAHSNPQPAYERVFFDDGYYLVLYDNEEAFNADTRDRYIINDAGEYEKVTAYNSTDDYYVFMTAAEGFAARTYDIFRWTDAEHTSHTLVGKDEVLNSNHKDTSIANETNAYFKKTDHIFGATNEKLSSPQKFEKYTFKGYLAPNTINGETLNLNQYQKDYTPVLKDLEISTYANTYTHDTYEYRMAKMLSECEEHLCMDSVVYHYLFIERHSMVDNVAKNTFWSTEDGKVWNLTKNYDNDTSDGNDNQGKLSLTYGFEPGDVDDGGVSIFNAGNSVWLAFIGGLYDACQTMYNHLDTKGAWSPTAYLKEHTKWQSAIPERCWIEDYYRKYLRPYEIYNSQMFLEMHEGGQKKHQRTQYELYQNYYISSKYFGTTCQANMFTLRAEGADITKIDVPVSLYADCYIRGAYGSGTTNPNLSIRCKRNTDILIKSPITNATDATIYLWPSNLYQQLGDNTSGLNDYGLTQFEAANAKKLRTISLGIYSGSTNNTLKKITFESNENLENVYVAKYAAAETLDLTDSPGLIHVDARGSGFSSVTLPENAPTEKVLLQAPVTLNVSNLSNLTEFTIADYTALQDAQIEDIDRSPGVNSKNIIDNATNLLRYKLRDVIWSISDPAEINTTNNTISILEKLLALKPSADITGQTVSRQDALTGVLTIAPGAENFNISNEKALQIYETYAKANEDYVKIAYKNEEVFNEDPRTKYILVDDEYEPTTSYDSSQTYYVIGLAAKYPNLDIIFADNTLYSVNIYDGDNNIKWSRKTIKNGTVNADFLKYGPDGSFTSSSVQKTSTAEYEYVFLNKWIIKNDAGQEIATLNSAEPIYTGSIQGNIHMHPQFETRKRSYEVVIKVEDPTSETVTVLKEGTYEYGTPLSNVIPTDVIPYVDSSSLGLLEVYDFKGYSLVKGSSTLVSNNYKVTGAATLWAVFKRESDIRKIVHPEWFNITNDNLTYSETEGNFATGIIGVQIEPAYTLQGKITIPATMTLEDGTVLPVISVTGFGGNSEKQTTSTHTLTHIFMQNDNQLYKIEKSAFYKIPTLVYFDFEKCAVRDIGQYAFAHCSKLATTSVGYQTYRIRDFAFNNSITSNGLIVTLFISPTVLRIDDGALSMLRIAGDSTLQIGSTEELSVLNLSNSYPDSTFVLSESSRYKHINFYSSRYTSADSSCKGTTTVRDMFLKALSSDTDASLYVGTGA